MDRKITVYAGWLVFVPMLFMSVFYLLADRFLQEGRSASVLTALAICIFVAFAGTKLLSDAVRPLRAAVKRRRFRPARVYVPLIIRVSITCALGAVLLNLLVAVFSGVSFWGLAGFYPMLSENMLAHPVLTLVLLALLPAVLEEFLLRGRVFSLCEREGTAAAVFFGALIMPLFYVYPHCAMAALLIGAVCGLLCALTDSLAAAVAVHLSCRTALWIGDLLAHDPAFMKYAAVYVCILVFLFFLCVYRTLRTYTNLLHDDLLRHPVPGARQATVNLKNLLLTPGFGLFAAVFLVRFAAMLIPRLR